MELMAKTHSRAFRQLHRLQTHSCAVSRYIWFSIGRIRELSTALSNRGSALDRDRAQESTFLIMFLALWHICLSGTNVIARRLN